VRMCEFFSQINAPGLVSLGTSHFRRNKAWGRESRQKEYKSVVRLLPSANVRTGVKIFCIEQKTPGFLDPGAYSIRAVVVIIEFNV